MTTRLALSQLRQHVAEHHQDFAAAIDGALRDPDAMSSYRWGVANRNRPIRFLHLTLLPDGEALSSQRLTQSVAAEDALRRQVRDQHWVNPLAVNEHSLVIARPAPSRLYVDVFTTLEPA